MRRRKGAKGRGWSRPFPVKTLGAELLYCGVKNTPVAGHINATGYPAVYTDTINPPTVYRAITDIGLACAVRFGKHHAITYDASGIGSTVFGGPASGTSLTADGATSSHHSTTFPTPESTWIRVTGHRFRQSFQNRGPAPCHLRFTRWVIKRRVAADEGFPAFNCDHFMLTSNLPTHGLTASAEGGDVHSYIAPDLVSLITLGYHMRINPYWPKYNTYLSGFSGSAIVTNQTFITDGTTEPAAAFTNRYLSTDNNDPRVTVAGAGNGDPSWQFLPQLNLRQNSLFRRYARVKKVARVTLKPGGRVQFTTRLKSCVINPAMHRTGSQYYSTTVGTGINYTVPSAIDTFWGRGDPVPTQGFELMIYGPNLLDTDLSDKPIYGPAKVSYTTTETVKIQYKFTGPRKPLSLNDNGHFKAATTTTGLAVSDGSGYYQRAVTNDGVVITN